MPLHYQEIYNRSHCDESPTGLRPIYVIFFECLPISFQMKNNDDMWL